MTNPINVTPQSGRIIFGSTGSALLPVLLDANGQVIISPSSSAQSLDMSRLISAAFTTLTRPANTTAYSANDSISDNATPASVSALPATVSDINDAPLILTELLLDTTDTGLAAAVQVRAYLFNSDPTASSGVQGGDNTAYSNKRAGFIGSMSGTFRAFFDGGKARLVPDEGSYIVTKPQSGGQQLWIQFQTLGAFTPSANSTTIAATVRGFQGRV